MDFAEFCFECGEKFVGGVGFFLVSCLFEEGGFAGVGVADEGGYFESLFPAAFALAGVDFLDG